ncbi:MAG: hypothetical protein ABF991_00755 [Liquorilactobacillus hordei]|uniref:hypothetical protein n=1 Tax=Liquorilactobacillus hordei TaxID=468911 RepID=UPI0039EAF133
MNSFADNFRNHMKRVGATRYDRNMHDKTREFNNYFANALDKEACVIDGVETQAIFQDQSQSNNKELSDDKYIVLPNSVECSVGSYVIWRDEQWLIFTGEFKTIATHQQLKIKHVNHSIKWIVDKETKKVSNNGDGWGAYVQNQTLYTLGVSFTGNNLSLINGKMMLYVKNNSETSQITIGDRFFISGKIYKVEFADSISRIGLINLLLDEDTLNPEVDNVQLGIANYWGSNGKDDEQKNNSDNSNVTTSTIEIIGDQKARLGRSYNYSVVQVNEDGSKTPLKVSEWNIESIQTLPINILERDENTLQFSVIDDSRYIGNTMNILAKVNNQYQSLSVKIIAKF